MTAIPAEHGRVDLVSGGCGTGQGSDAAVAVSGSPLGHILTPAGRLAVRQINNGNCISLALNQGYGWAGDVNLRHIFDMYSAVEQRRRLPVPPQGPAAGMPGRCWRG